MSLPQLRLDNQLCFLFHRISRELTAAYRPSLEGLGLTYPQYLVMLVLWETDGVSVGQIGQRLSLDSATLSPLLRRLVEAGLVVKQRGQADERRVTVHLTQAGRDLEARAADVPFELAARVSADHAEYVELRNRLEALLARIDDERSPGRHRAPVQHGAPALHGAPVLQRAQGQRVADHMLDSAIPAASSTP